MRLPFLSGSGTCIVVLLAVLAAAAGCGGEGGPQRVTFMAGFKPQANLPFVGVYVAQEQGFFADEGLQVEIQHDTSGQGQAVQLLLAGQVQFTTADAAVVLQRRADPGLPLVAIALLGQRGQQGYAVMADSGITDPSQWKGKVVGYKGAAAPPDLFAILDSVGLAPEDIQLVNIGFDPRIFAEGQVDVYPLFLSNEPWVLENVLGKQIRIFEAADLGIPTLGLTYVTSEEIIGKDPDTVERFLRATLRGIAWAAEHRDEAVQIVLQYAPQENPDHMRFMLDTELAAALTPQTEAQGIGWMTPEQWHGLYETLAKYSALPEDFDVEAAFDTSFLEEIYEGSAME